MRITSNSFLLGVMMASIMILQACGETSIPQEAELDRYPEFKPFLAGRTGFEGIKHEIDVGTYVFSFPTSYKTSEGYFASVHPAAMKEGWKLETSETLKREYVRPSNDYPAATHDNRVTLTYNPDKASVLFIEKPDYSKRKKQDSGN